mmetsp:Transcript_35801/g.78396  ORF Transcript_35801/g.78396 Transcript_35801/m.78396 type:complete len:317 (+) Transcript_35801:123-1073(+)
MYNRLAYTEPTRPTMNENIKYSNLTCAANSAAVLQIHCKCRGGNRPIGSTRSSSTNGTAGKGRRHLEVHTLAHKLGHECVPALVLGLGLNAAKEHHRLLVNVEVLQDHGIFEMIGLGGTEYDGNVLPTRQGVEHGNLGEVAAGGIGKLDGEVAAAVVLGVAVGLLDALDAPFVGAALDGHVEGGGVNFLLGPQIGLGHEAFGEDFPAKELNTTIIVPVNLMRVVGVGDGIRARPNLTVGNGQGILRTVGTGRDEALALGVLVGCLEPIEVPVRHTPPLDLAGSDRLVDPVDELLDGDARIVAMEHVQIDKVSVEGV